MFLRSNVAQNVPLPDIWILFVDILEHSLEEQSVSCEVCVNSGQYKHRNKAGINISTTEIWTHDPKF